MVRLTTWILLIRFVELLNETQEKLGKRVLPFVSEMIRDIAAAADKHLADRRGSEVGDFRERDEASAFIQ